LTHNNRVAEGSQTGQGKEGGNNPAGRDTDDGAEREEVSQGGVGGGKSEGEGEEEDEE
jgi:hypothetical protein